MRLSSLIISQAFSAIIIAAAFVLEEISLGIIELSTILRCDIPRIRNLTSTTAVSSAPILAVPAA